MSANLWAWLIVIVVLGAIELATIQLVAIWPAIGGVAALLAATFHQSLAVQFILFIAVSGILLIFTRPLVKGLVRTPLRVSTNADRLIGSEALVTQRIDNVTGTGTVVVSGVTWTARSKDGTPVEKGQSVQIDRIEGVKLIVSPKKTAESS